MMRIIQSPVVAAVAGVILYLATTVMLWRAPVNISSALQPEDELASMVTSPSWSYRNPEIEQLIIDLKKEKETLSLRRQELNDLTARLATERLEINLVLQNMTRMQKEFDANVVRVREEETANLKKLAKVYATMTPDGATTIFKEMEDDKIVKIFLFMKEAETAPILEGMSKGGDMEAKRAALISDRLRLAISRPPASKSKAQ
jgi:flagellar motility protein MotE (MotC chaperone)